VPGSSPAFLAFRDVRAKLFVQRIGLRTYPSRLF
jgi:hypothetical protein